MKISRTQKELIKKLAKKYGLRLVLLFGSQVASGGRYIHKFSDIDMAFLAKEKVDLLKQARILTELMGILKTNEVDLVNLSNASPFLASEIFKDYQVLFNEDENMLTEYEIFCLKMNLEAKKLYQFKHKLLDDQIKKFKKDLAHA